MLCACVLAVRRVRPSVCLSVCLSCDLCLCCFGVGFGVLRVRGLRLAFLSELNMLQLSVRSVIQGFFKDVAAIPSYENGQSTLHMLQVPFRTSTMLFHA